MIRNFNPGMAEFITLTKALSDPNRVRALFALRNGELCVCQIIELLGLAPSTVSKHMTVLKQAGLVKNRKEERWMHYRLTEKDDMPPMIRDLFNWAFGTLKSDETVTNDQKTLQRITTQDLSNLCKMQRNR
jgi:DNA-binding transcriptional ArsR family regulator